MQGRRGVRSAKTGIGVAEGAFPGPFPPAPADVRLPRKVGAAPPRFQVPAQSLLDPRGLGRFASVGGQRLSYAVAGDGPHNVLCLPGALGSWRTDFAAQLSEAGMLDVGKFRVVAWDPPGYGDSRPPTRDFGAGYFERDAAAAAGLMGELGLEPFSVLGWSDGGITALFLAANHNKALRKSVVWGANAFVDAADVAIYASIRDIDAWSARMRAPFEAMYGEPEFRRLWQAWTDAFIQLGEGDGNVCKELLGKIAHPTLVLHGAKDPVVPQHHADFLVKGIKGARLIVHDEGKHNLHLRYPEWFREQVQAFLSEQEQSHL